MKGFSVVQGGGTIIALLAGVRLKDTVRTPAPWVCVGFALLCHGVAGCVQDAPPTATPKNDGYPGQWVRLTKAHVAKTWCYRSISIRKDGGSGGAVGAYQRVRALAFHLRYQVPTGNGDLKPNQALNPLDRNGVTIFVYVNREGFLGYGLRTDNLSSQSTNKAPKELHCDGMVEYPVEKDHGKGSLIGKKRSWANAAAGMARAVAQHFRFLLFPRAHALGEAGNRVTGQLGEFLKQQPSLGKEMDEWLRSTPFEELRIIRSQARYEDENERADYRETPTKDAGAKRWFSKFLDTWNTPPPSDHRRDFSLIDDIARMVMGTELLRRYMDLRHAGALRRGDDFPVDLSLPGFFATLSAAELDIDDIRFQHFVKQLQARGRADGGIPKTLKRSLCTKALTVRKESGEVPLLDGRLLDYYCDGKFIKDEEIVNREPVDALKPPTGRTPRTEIQPMFSLIINGTAYEKTGYPNIKAHLVEKREPRTVYIPDVTRTYGILEMSGWSTFDCQGGGNGLSTRQLALTVQTNGGKIRQLWVLAQAKTIEDQHPSKPWETYVSVHDERPELTTNCPVDKWDYVLTHENDEALREAVELVTGLLEVENEKAETSAVFGALAAFHGRGISEWVDPISTMPEPDELPKETPELSEPELSISDVDIYTCLLPSGAERGVTVSLSNNKGWKQTWYASKDYFWLSDSTCANLETTQTNRICACWEAWDSNQTKLKNGQSAENGFKPIRDRLLREMAAHYQDGIPQKDIDQIDEMFQNLWK